MTILIIYESIEGQTAKITMFVQAMLIRLGNEVSTADTSDPMLQISFENVDRVVLAAPVHERRHPISFELFISTERGSLSKLATLMLSISLKAAFENAKDEAADFLTEMEMRTGFSATRKALVAGAVRRGNYDYFASQILRHVVLDGQDPNLAAKDQEFTDWAALENEVLDFLRVEQN